MKTVFITGANRGLGFELVKKFSSELHYKVFMGCRRIEKGKEALASLPVNKNIIPIEIDVSSEESVKKAFQFYTENTSEKINVFINNAGASLDWIPNGPFYKALEIPIETLDMIFRTNCFGAILTTRYFLPVMAENSRIVNVSSGAGELWDHNANKDFQIGYAPSKLALLMITKKLAAAVADKKIICNACCPDWCQTDMGGSEATFSPSHGAESIIKAAFLDIESSPSLPTGRYFRDGKLIPTDIIPAYEKTEIKEKHKKHPTFLEKIFSVRNENKRKVIRIFGFKLQLKEKSHELKR